jgi:hypothetical protein
MGQECTGTIIDRGESCIDVSEILPAGIGEQYGVVPAMEELDAKSVLKRFDLPADRPRRKVQLPRGECEAACACRDRERR